MPTQVFVASTYTYDVAVNGFIFLGTAMWLKVMTEEKEGISSGGLQEASWPLPWELWQKQSTFHWC